MKRTGNRVIALGMAVAMAVLSLGVLPQPSAALTQSFSNQNDYYYSNGGGGTSRYAYSPIYVNVGLTITRIDVTCTVVANWNGNDASDVDVFVRHPDGTDQQLVWYGTSYSGASISNTFYDIFRFNGKLSTGMWYLWVRDAQNTGNWATTGGYIDSWTLIIHYQEPSVTVTAPASAGAVLKGIYRLGATVVGAGIEHMQVSVDERFVSDMTLSGNSYYYDLNTARWPDGEHAVAVTAVDWQGRTDTKSVPVQFDNVLPAIGFAQLVDNSFVRGVRQLLVSGSNGEPSMTVRITMNGPSSAVDAQMLSLGSDYFVWSWDTTVFPDGTYMIGATTTDSAGNTATTGPYTLTIDNTPPALAVPGPAPGVYVSGTVTLDLSGTADANADFTQYRIDGGPWMPPAPAWNESFAIDTTALADGQHRLFARAVDLAGWSAEAYVDVVVNNADPVLGLVSPSEGDLLEGQATARARASAFLPVTGVTFVLDGTGRPGGLSGLSGFFEMPLDTTQLSDGQHLLSAIATDASGKTVAATGASFSVDNHPPELGVLSPSEGERVFGEVQLEVAASDLFLEGVRWRLDGGPYQWMTLSGQNHTASLSTGGLTEGAHLIGLLATDTIGHRTSAEVTVNVDNSVPSVEVVSPAANVYLEGTTVFRVRAFDERGLAAVVLHISGQPNRTISLNTVTGYYELELDTRGLSEGVHSCWAEATDLAGRSVATEQVSFQVDNAPPKLEMRYPVNGLLVTGRDGSKKIDANPSDTFLSDVLYNIDGGLWTSPAVPFTDGLSDGTHRLTLRAYDIPGRFTEVSVEFRYDATPPALAVVSPQSELWTRGALRVVVSASDMMGIDSVTVTPDATTGAALRAMAFNPSNGLYEAELDTSRWQGGDRTVALLVSATDGSGYSASASLSAFVDNSAPVITRLLPGGSWEGTVEFRFNVTDSSALRTVLFRRDGGEWTEMTYRESRGAYSTLWRTSLADNGQHIYEVRAVDGLGNAATASYTVSIENKDYGWLVWVVLAVLVLAILGYMFIARRRGPRAEPGDAPGPEPPETPEAKPSPSEAAGRTGDRQPARDSPWEPDTAPDAPGPPERGRPDSDELDKLVRDLGK